MFTLRAHPLRAMRNAHKILPTDKVIRVGATHVRGRPGASGGRVRSAVVAPDRSRRDIEPSEHIAARRDAHQEAQAMKYRKAGIEGLGTSGGGGHFTPPRPRGRRH